MKLAHYQMLDALRQADTNTAVRIFQEHFGLDIRDLPVEVYPAHYNGDKVHLWHGTGYYSWSPEAGFGTSFGLWERRTSLAITLRI